MTDDLQARLDKLMEANAGISAQAQRVHDAALRIVAAHERIDKLTSEAVKSLMKAVQNLERMLAFVQGVQLGHSERLKAVDERLKNLEDAVSALEISKHHR